MKIINRIKTSYSLWFVFIAIIVFNPFWRKGLSLIWNIDGVGQYYPAFLYVGKWLRNQFSGLSFINGIQKFDLGIAMGENIISSLNYYGFGDPLNLLSIFSDLENGAYIFSAMIILRLYLSGLAFMAYCHYMKLDELLAKIGALAYAFSAYALLGGLRYMEFLSPLIYLPLILYGCEKIWKEKKYVFLVLAVLYASLCNLYFLYMVGLYLVVYCMIRTWFIFGHNPKEMLLNCLKCFLSALSGFIISLPISYWFIYGLLSSTRSNISIVDIIFNINNWKPSLKKMLSYCTGFLPIKDYWGNIPVIVCIILVISLFLWKSRCQKQCALACWIGSVLTVLPITYSVFSGFSNTYDRWHFLLIFSYLIVFVVNTDKIIKYRFPGAETRIKMVVALLTILNIAIGDFYLSVGLSNSFIGLETAQMYVDSPVDHSIVLKNDTDVYRVSNDPLTGINGRPENVAMINDYYGLTFWFSVINENTQTIVNRLGTDNQNNWRSYGLKNSLLYETMAGVKYYLNHENDVFPAEYEFIESIDFYGEEWNLYRNPYALPLMYAVEADYYETMLEKNYYSENLSVLNNIIVTDNLEMKRDNISADINMEKEGYVLLAVPYSNIWTAYIDDEETEVFQSNILYLAIKVGKGEHHVVFQY